MKPEHLKQLINAKRQWTEPLAPEDKKKGFKSWYSSNHLPHFDAPGTQQFITYRLADALPASRRSEWEAFLTLEDDLEKQRQIEAYLDRGYGQCHLRDARIAELVQGNLWHHDGVKYRLLAWVIMPNHVHALIEVWQVPLGEILKSWKSYTSKEANKILGRSGTFWLDDYSTRTCATRNNSGKPSATLRTIQPKPGWYARPKNGRGAARGIEARRTSPHARSRTRTSITSLRPRWKGVGTARPHNQSEQTCGDKLSPPLFYEPPHPPCVQTQLRVVQGPGLSRLPRLRSGRGRPVPAKRRSAGSGDEPSPPPPQEREPDSA